MMTEGTSGEYWEKIYGPLIGTLHSRAQFYGALLRRLSFTTETTVRDQVGRAVRDAYMQVSSDMDAEKRDCLAALHYSRFCHRSDIVPLEQVVIVTQMVKDALQDKDPFTLERAMREAGTIRNHLEESIDTLKAKVFNQLRSPYSNSAGHTPSPIGRP